MRCFKHKVYFSFLLNNRIEKCLGSRHHHEQQHLAFRITSNGYEDCSDRASLFHSLVDFFAGVITVAPSLAFTESGTSALPGVLAFSGTEPVLGLIDIAINHELSALLVFIPIVSVHGLLVWEEFSEVIWESDSGFGGRNQCNEGKSNFHQHS